MGDKKMCEKDQTRDSVGELPFDCSKEVEGVDENNKTGWGCGESQRQGFDG